MKSLHLAACVVSVFTVGGIAAQRGTLRPGFRELLQLHRLGHLSDEDAIRVQAFVDSMVQTATRLDRSRLEALDSITGYMQGQGFAPRIVRSARVGDQDALVVEGYYTTDVPPGLASVPLGTYFVREGFSGGITGIIADGEKFDLSLARWHRLRN